jgi:aminoglycoside 3-N-acetyltransferase
VSPRAHYDRDDLVRAFAEVGVRQGDVVFSHTGVAMLGIPPVALEPAAIGDLFLDAMRTALGPEGTWVIPAYTYSYTKDELFDPATTATTLDMGAVPEGIWNHPDGRRSLDPIFSVVAFGPRAGELVAGVPASCFGAD